MRRTSLATALFAILCLVGAAGCSAGSSSADTILTMGHAIGDSASPPDIVQDGTGARVILRLTPGSGPLGIAAGPSRTVWVAENAAGRIARISLTTNKI